VGWWACWLPAPARRTMEVAALGRPTQGLLERGGRAPEHWTMQVSSARSRERQRGVHPARSGTPPETHRDDCLTRQDPYRSLPWSLPSAPRSQHTRPTPTQYAQKLVTVLRLSWFHGEIG
jgi:hypothetical protein